MKFTLMFSLFLFFLSSPLKASSLQVKLGPPAVGLGGPNPISIPPVNPLDYEITYMSDGLWEFSASAVPGLTIGKRFYFSYLYGSFGGGLMVASDGVGLGGYSAIGLDTGAKSKSVVSFITEYKQTLALNGYGLIMSYALRLGVAVNF